MARSRRSYATSLATAALVAAIAAAPAASAQVPVPTDNAFAIPGASIDYWAPALLNRFNPWADDGPLVAQINAHYYDCTGCSSIVVRYPRTAGPLFGPGAPFADRSIAIGASVAIDDVRNAMGSSVIAGLSLGAITAGATQQALDADPLGPNRSHVAFIVAGDPSRVTPLSMGLGSFMPAGWRIPLLGWTVTRPPSESVYDTVVVVGEYDLVADFPDRPWNLLAVFNAVAGMAYVHSQSALSTPTAVPPENITSTTNSNGAITTTYLVPSPQLPLLKPFNGILSPSVITTANDVLKPIVDRGYSRNDAENGNRMPYLESTDGLPELVVPSDSLQPAPTTRDINPTSSRTPARTPRPAPAAAAAVGHSPPPQTAPRPRAGDHRR
ncbi:PE-PPE domain-containing protein [Mycolicibacterium sp.]|uniref:PE-PPE domain-containing protein n=1 Tax=Mycolicibacterium sp. TaxID=2320850 RepID=UPI0028ADD179|nr:PE-PPE domain-containing protein [Mycolicibacterium sp.]